MKNIKLNISILFLVTINTFLFTGCTSKNTIKPFVGNCCLDNETKTISKNIYIGHFKIVDERNKQNIFGTTDKLTDFLRNKEVIPLTFKENINDILREEMYRRFLVLTKNVYLVDSKPKEFNERTDIYIDGKINTLWIDQIFRWYGEFDTTNEYLFDITCNINNRIFNDKINAKLISKTTNFETNDAMQLSMVLLVGIPIFNELSRGFEHKFYIGNKLISEIYYNTYKENVVFYNNYKINLIANTYDKSKLNILDKNEGSFGVPYPGYSYRSYNINTATVSNYSPLTDFRNDFYYSKDELNVMRQQNKEYKEIYNQCVSKNNILSSEKCNEEYVSELLDNNQYYDLFRLYTTTSGIIQYMINHHIDKIIEKIRNIN